MTLHDIRNFLFNTLRGRLILSVAAVHAVMMTLFIIDLTIRQHTMLLDRQEETAIALSQSLSTAAADWLAADDISGLQELVESQRRYPELLYAILVDEEGHILAHTAQSKQGQYLLDLPHDVRQTIINKTPDLVDVATPSFLNGKLVGWARVGLGQNTASKRLTEIILYGAFYALAAIAIGVLIAWQMGRRITRRLYVVQNTIGEIRTGNRTARSKVSGKDEAATIASEFNIMLDTLAELEVELRTSAEKYRSLIQKVQAAIVLHDNQGRILTSNPLAQRLLGLTEEQLQGKELIDPDWHFLREDGSIMPIAEYPIGRVLKSNQPLRDYLAGISCPDRDEITWVLVNAEPEFDETGEIEQILVSFVDITERKLAESNIENLNRNLRMLSDVNQALIRIKDEGSLLDEVCRIIVEIGGYRIAWVGFAEHDEDQTLQPVAHAGFDSGYIESAKISWGENERGRGPGGSAIRSGKPCIVRDILTDSNFVPWRESAIQRGFNSLIALPLICESETIGALGIYSANKNSFDKNEVDILVELAGDLGFGISTLRTKAKKEQAEEALHLLNRELRAISNCNQILVRAKDEATLLSEICHIVCDEAGYRMAWVGYPVNDEAKSIQVVSCAGAEDGFLKRAKLSWAATERGNGPSGMAIRSGTTATIQDFDSDPIAGPWRDNALKQNYRSSIALPLKDERNLTFGIFNIYSSKPNTFTPDEIRLLEELAGDLAFGITSLRMRAQNDLSQETLQHKQIMLERTESIAHIGSWEWEVATDSVTWSEELYRIFDRNPAGKAPSFAEHPELYHPEDMVQLKVAVAKALSDGTPYELELRAFRTDGEMRICLARGHAEFDSVGNVRRLFGSLQDITDHKQIEEELRKSEEKYRTIFTNSALGIFRSTIEGKFLEVNPAFADMLGYDSPETVIHEIHDIGKQVYANETDRSLIIDRLFHSDESIQIQNKYRRKNGSQFDANLYLKKVCDTEGRILFLDGIVEDISERKRIENALLRSERLYSTILKTAMDGFWMTDLSGRLLKVNDAYCRMICFNESTLLKMSISDLEDVESKSDVATHIRKVIEQGEDRFETRHRRRDGSVFDVEVSVKYHDIESGQLVMFLRDITEHKHAEEAIRESERRYRDIFDNVLDSLYLIDVTDDGRFRTVEVNPALERSTGIPRSFSVGKTQEETVPPEVAAIVNAKYRRCVETELPIEEEVELDLPSGRHCFQSVIIPAKDETGRVSRLIGISRDITEHKRAEEELRISHHQMRTLAARLQVAREEERTHIAREIHDVLSQILTRLKIDLVWLNGRMSDTSKNFSMEALANRVIEMSQMTDEAIRSVQEIATELRPAVLDSLGLSAAVEWLAHDFQTRCGIACRTDIVEEGQSPDRNSSTTIFRILQESLTNILRHSHATQVDIRLVHTCDHVELTVRDNGRGISTEILNSPMSIGLVGMRERALLLNGNFDISSQQQIGTTINVSVPLNSKIDAQE